MRAYYNEFEPFAANWLRELITEGLIPDGDVDDRSITDVEPEDLKDYTQCHFFAGIGGWAYATRLAGWPDDRPIWTGSPPCQPFSTAGKRKGKSDERHLWPVWFDLVRKCRPPTIFGEQVSAAIRYGWLDQLQEDLEASEYAVGSVIVPASSVGALHKRDRLWFVAHSISQGLQGRLPWGQDSQREVERGHPRCGSATGIDMAHPNDLRHEWSEGTRREAERRPEHTGNGPLGNTEHSGSHGVTQRGSAEAAGPGSAQGQDISLQSAGAGGRALSGDLRGVRSLANSDDPGQLSTSGPVQQNQWDNPWGRCEAVRCKDGKVRAIPTEPEIFPLANGLSNRVGILRGAGNAIVPQVASEILKIFI